MKKVAAIIKLIRPHEWVKNLFVFAPAVFSGRLLEPGVAAASAIAWAFFCAASSFVYVFNDLLDASHDQQHPVKQHRPIPSGRVSKAEAGLLAVGCFIIPQLAALSAPSLWAILNLYIMIGMAYSLYLKKKVIIDVLTISVGFVLRVLAGAAVIKVMPSEWLILCTFLLATFLGFSKRRHELIQLGDAARAHRWVLRHYSAEFLDQMNLITITLTLICYIFYTIAPETIHRFGTRHLLYSVLLVMLGLFRYLFMVHQKGKGSPVEVLYTDRQIVLITLLWLFYMAWFIYAWPALQ